MEGFIKIEAKNKVVSGIEAEHPEDGNCLSSCREELKLPEELLLTMTLYFITMFLAYIYLFLLRWKNPPATGKARIPANAKCRACSMEAEFVSEGMIPCEKCHAVYYCSQDCLQWHWKQGGHTKECTGASEQEVPVIFSKNKSNNKILQKNSIDAGYESDEKSIDPFEDMPARPQGSGGIMAALAQSRAQIEQANAEQEAQEAAPKAKRKTTLERLGLKSSRKRREGKKKK